jgi:hypothetical protein
MSLILTTKCDREGCHRTTGKEDKKWFSLSGIIKNETAPGVPPGLCLKLGLSDSVVPNNTTYHLCSFECLTVKLKGLIYGNGAKPAETSLSEYQYPYATWSTERLEREIVSALKSIESPHIYTTDREKLIEKVNMLSAEKDRRNKVPSTLETKE